MKYIMILLALTSLNLHSEPAIPSTHSENPFTLGENMGVSNRGIWVNVFNDTPYNLGFSVELLSINGEKIEPSISQDISSNFRGFSQLTARIDWYPYFLEFEPGEHTISLGFNGVAPRPHPTGVVSNKDPVYISFTIPEPTDLNRYIRVVVDNTTEFYVPSVVLPLHNTSFYHKIFRFTDMAYVLSGTDLSFNLTNYVAPIIGPHGSSTFHHVFDLHFGEKFEPWDNLFSPILYQGFSHQRNSTEVIFNFYDELVSYRTRFAVINQEFFTTLRTMSTLLGISYFYDFSENVLHINTLQPYISQYGQLAVTEFLQYVVDTRPLTRDIPPMYELYGFHDFRLIYLGQNGIPAVLITHVRWPHSNFPELWVYYNGSFVNRPKREFYGLSVFPTFFKNTYGNIVVFGEEGGGGFFAYYFENFQLTRTHGDFYEMNRAVEPFSGNFLFEYFYYLFELTMIPRQLLPLYLEVYQQVFGY